MGKTTTVEIKTDLREILEDMKLHPREPIDEVIRRGMGIKKGVPDSKRRI